MYFQAVESIEEFGSTKLTKTSYTEESTKVVQSSTTTQQVNIAFLRLPEIQSWNAPGEICKF